MSASTQTSGIVRLLPDRRVLRRKRAVAMSVIIYKNSMAFYLDKRPPIWYNVSQVDCYGPKKGQMDRLLLRPTEAAELIGVGRSKMYQLLASGELPTVLVGGSVRVPLAKLREWIDLRTRDLGTLNG